VKRLERLCAWASATPQARDALIPVALGALLRALAVIWAAQRFPPVDDGHFYHVLASRLAAGQGYTWQWADGTVTFVAHYPVGYPLLAAFGYWLLGAVPAVAMAENALLGAAAVFFVHEIARTRANRGGATFAALAVALHPGLVLYTPALMTEGVTAALLALAGYLVVRARGAPRRRHAAWLVALGALMGAATLVRAESLLLAPLFGLIAARESRWVSRLSALALTTVVATATIAPWTARNCARMDRCVVVSANAGWNLLIGTLPDADGTFAPIAGETVPRRCRTVFGEAAKDDCFLSAALAEIRQHPWRWLGLAPKKLARTFDPGGTAAWYLAASNPSAFGAAARHVLAALEVFWERALVLLGLVALARAEGPRRDLRRGLSLLSALALLSPWAFVAFLGTVAVALALGRELLGHPPAALLATAIGATALTHALVFGAGRYAMPVFALSAALSGLAFAGRAAKSGRFDIGVSAG
jgi:4-amino-4-deoxy-L-arabinose transferase-like glycosyltransferase